MVIYDGLYSPLSVSYLSFTAAVLDSTAASCLLPAQVRSNGRLYLIWTRSGCLAEPSGSIRITTRSAALSARAAVSVFLLPPGPDVHDALGSASRPTQALQEGQGARHGPEGPPAHKHRPAANHGKAPGSKDRVCPFFLQFYTTVSLTPSQCHASPRASGSRAGARETAAAAPSSRPQASESAARRFRSAYRP